MVTFFIDLMIAALSVCLAVCGIQTSGEGSWMYLLLAPIIEWVTEASLDRWRLYQAVGYIKKAMDSPKGYDEGRVTRTQESIYAYRCLRPVPDFVYRLTKRNEQEKADYRL